VKKDAQKYGVRRETKNVLQLIPQSIKFKEWGFLAPKVGIELIHALWPVTFLKTPPVCISTDRKIARRTNAGTRSSCALEEENFKTWE
jgi:hypothetical protein